jgi:hypothetical protein
LQTLILWEKAKKLIPGRKKAGNMLLDQIEASPAFEENAPIQTLEATIDGKKIRVRIFKEPELRREIKSTQPTFLED